MKCKDCEDRLLEYLYGELGEEEAAGMERHLEASEPCRKEYESLRSVLETVSRAEESGPPPALHTRIMGHAEEARLGRRALWAWAFRPAVTTVMIGAIAAGVYFATLRHKPPSLRDESVLTEEALLVRSKRPSSAPPPEREDRTPRTDSALTESAKPEISSSAGAKDDAPQKKAREPGFLAGLAEPPAAGEQEEAAPPAPKPLADSELRMLARPSAKEQAFPPTSSMEEEPAAAPGRMKAAAPLSEEHLFQTEGRERAPGQTYGTHTKPMALSASPDRDRMEETKQAVPWAISQALDLASEGECAEAEKLTDAYALDHPEDEACGTGWLEVARCHEKKGDAEAARATAEKALAIRATEPEARTFLESLPSPPE